MHQLLLMIPAWDGKSVLSVEILKAVQKDLVKHGFKKRHTAALKW